METKPVRYAITGEGVVTVTLDQPETRNALSDFLLKELIAALQRAEVDADCRCIVIASSHERVFSAGGDLGAFRDERSVVEKYHGADLFPELFLLVGRLSKPVIAAVNGHALAGALGLVLACDLVIAAEDAGFGCPEINIGAFPFMVSALLTRSIGRLKANELMYFGDRISARDAQQLGIVNHVVGERDFSKTVDDWSSRLASKSPLILRMGKESTTAISDMSVPEALRFMQGQLALAFSTDDLQEGVNAFFDHREPVWTGK